MASKEIKIGDKAPEFTLPSTEGRDISLKDYLGEKTVILYFYPKDNTPGCTKEACSFRDNFKKFSSKDAMILGVSLDRLESHRKFIEKHDLPFPLLSDEEAKVSKAYGVYKEKKLYGRTFWGIMRTTFVIGPNGKIQAIYPKVKVEGHVEEVLASL